MSVAEQCVPDKGLVLLLLLIGIPASGKSTWLRQLEEEVKSVMLGTGEAVKEEASNTAEGTHYYLNPPLLLSKGGAFDGSAWNPSLKSLHLFRVDDVMRDMAMREREEGGKRGARPAPNVGVFTPERWKSAGERLYRAVQGQLAQLTETAAAADSGVLGMAARDVHLVVVEDVMQYRSMRERFWKLCVTASRVSACRLLELRLDTPLDVCLQRNEERLRAVSREFAGQVGEEAEYVDPQVLRSLFHRFELGEVRHEEQTKVAALSEDVAGAVPRLPPSYMFLRVVSWPWAVLRLSMGVAQAARSNEAKDFLFGVIPHPQTNLLVVHQQQAWLEQRRRQAVEAHQKEALALQSRRGIAASWSHRFDQMMRATVSEVLPRYTLNWKTTEEKTDRTRRACLSAAVPKVTQRLKQRYLTEFKSFIAEREEGTGEEWCAQWVQGFKESLEEELKRLRENTQNI